MALLRAQPHEFTLAALAALAVNLFTFLAIRHLSATGFKVAGCFNNALVVWAGILQRDLVTPRELQGYALSLLGFLLYSAAWRPHSPSGLPHSALLQKRGA